MAAREILEVKDLTSFGHKLLEAYKVKEDIDNDDLQYVEELYRKGTLSKTDLVACICCFTVWKIGDLNRLYTIFLDHLCTISSEVNSLIPYPVDHRIYYFSITQFLVLFEAPVEVIQAINTVVKFSDLVESNIFKYKFSKAFQKEYGRCKELLEVNAHENESHNNAFSQTLGNCVGGNPVKLEDESNNTMNQDCVVEVVNSVACAANEEANKNALPDDMGYVRRLLSSFLGGFGFWNSNDVRAVREESNYIANP
jgi:hypothetical protein